MHNKSDLIGLFVTGFRFHEFIFNHNDTDWRRAGIGMCVVNVTVALKRDGKLKLRPSVCLCVFLATDRNTVVSEIPAEAH